MIRIILLTAAALAAVLLATAAWVCLSLGGAVRGIERLDEAGRLYVIDYAGDTDRPLLRAFPSLVTRIGCSAFAARDTEGGFLTGRNYDFVHQDENGNSAVLDVLIRMRPEGKYASVSSCDFEMFKKIGCEVFPGCLDHPGLFSRLALALAPLACEDGMNETGLSASILQLDTKEGETRTRQTEAGRRTATATTLLREILDTCKSVEEAKQLAAKVNMTACLGADYHIFVTDAEGNSTVLEWRHDRLSCVDTDACTNFFSGSDDACDCYKGGKLYEAYEPVTSLYGTYHMGYGHGYARFAAIVAGLDAHRSGPGLAALSRGEAMDLLQSVSQAGTPGVRTSGTLWSIVFRNSERAMDICIGRDYSRVYSVSAQ